MFKNYIQNYNELLQWIKKDKVVIFGTGHYGCMLCRRLLSEILPDQIVFCDNNIEKKGKEIFGCKVYLVEEAAKQFINAKFLVAEAHFLAEMLAQLSKYVEDSRIAVVMVDNLSMKSKEQRLKNSQQYIQQLLEHQQCLEKIDEVKEVKSITFRSKLIGGAGGGPAKVLELQEHALGDAWNNIRLSYQYKIENNISMSFDYELNKVLGSVEFARLLSQEDKQVVYIVHDIFSAFGLAINGKHYILVYHSQGEVVYEMKNMGRQFTSDEEKLIKQIELVSIQKASYVCFPSIGAEMFYWKSWGIEKIPSYSKGKPLYNCLAQRDLAICTELNGVRAENDVYTVLSIGQMTSAKGMDRIPEFLNNLSIQMQKKIRWIVVANGPLKDDILYHMEQISETNCKVSYIQFDRLKHTYINYLFKISDAYLMLHRISIFDLATLEAMYHNLLIMLSDIPGNREYNLHNNIIMIPEEVDYKKVVGQIYGYKKNNREIYEEEFSIDKFRKRYIDMIYAMIELCKGEEKTDAAK